MSIGYKHIIILFSVSVLAASCKTLENASLHGLTSGYYTLKTEDKNVQDVYLDVADDQVDVYDQIKGQPDKKQLYSIPLYITDTLLIHDMVFKKQGLDIDITSIVLKYRPSVQGLPAQLNTDLNVALYAGWRHDNFRVASKTNPMGKRYQKIGNMGYDFGFFVGPGATMVNAFTTNNRQVDDYSGMIIQAGFAGFLESNVASFGISIGYDHLLNPDRTIWIYRNKPWVGFIVGVALN